MVWNDNMQMLWVLKASQQQQMLQMIKMMNNFNMFYIHSPCSVETREKMKQDWRANFPAQESWWCAPSML